MADKQLLKQWQVPTYSPTGSNKKDVHSWMIGNVDDGKEFQEASPGFQQLQEAVRILSGKPSKELSEKQKDGYSQLMVNHLKRTIRDMVNALAEIRYNPGYQSKQTVNDKTAAALNSISFAWWIDNLIDLKWKKAIQWMAISPCGWLELCYRRLPGDHGRAEIDALPWSWFDVVMTGVPESGDFQEAYTVTIIKDLPIYLAHALWPDHTDKIKPDRETPKSWYDRIKDKAAKVVRDVFSQSQESEKATAKNPTCRLYYQYVLDLQVNRSGKKMYMGYEKGKAKDPNTGVEREIRVPTPWSYEVPTVGEMVLRGFKKNHETLQLEESYSPASPEECRIFPGRRLLVGTDIDMIYDGPMFDWHGKVPLVKLAADSWPFGEFSMMNDAVPIHEAQNEIDRVCHQTVRNRFDPSLMYNTRALTKPDAKKIRSDIQGDRIGFNGSEVQDASKAVSPLFSSTFNTIEGWIEHFQTRLTQEQEYILGRPNFSALAKMKVAVADDTTEQVLQDAGPIVKGISRDMERSMRDFADMFKYYVFQYKTAPEIVWMVGEDGMTPANFDYKPGNMIPAHLPGEIKSKPSVFTEMQRARWAADQLKFLLVPGTMHEIVQTKQKLIYMQLWSKGYPIDPVTLGEVLRLGNVGSIEGANMIEKYFNWKKKELEMMIELRKLTKDLLGEDAEPQSNTPGTGPRGGAKGSGGRASSMTAPPKLQQKGDGRPVERTSP